MSDNYNAYPYGRWIKWGVVALIAIILVGMFISTSNGLAASDQDVKSKWSQVENQMQRRSDVIAQLVDTVKGSVKLEQNIINSITTARSTLYSNTADVKSKLSANDSLTRDMTVLFENYPEIKSTELFANLQVGIEGSENRISVARKDFIDSVQNYNTKITRFPGSIFAKFMGYSQKDYFEAAQKETPKIEF